MSTRIHSSFDECNQQSTIGIKNKDYSVWKYPWKANEKSIYGIYIYLYILFTISYTIKKNLTTYWLVVCKW